MDEKDRKEVLDGVRAVVTEITGPLAAQVKELGEKVGSAVATATEAKAAAENGARMTYRLDAKGRLFPLGGGEVKQGDGKAPAFVRDGSLGDQPYSLARVVRAISDKDSAGCPLESHVSDKLKELGFPSQAGAKSWLIPLSSSEEYLPCDTGDGRKDTAMKSLRSLLEDALPVAYMDPEEQRAIIAKMGGEKGAMMQKAQDPFDDTLGGTLIPYPTRGELIEFLRASTVVGQAGAQQVAIPPGGIEYPAETGRTSFTRRAMGSQTTIADSTSKTGAVKLVPKELAGLVKIPNSLIRFSNPSVEAVVRRALSLDAALAADKDYLEGTGGTTTPLGITNYPQSATDTPTTNKLTLHVATITGGNGDTFAPEDVALMISLVEEAPDPVGPTAFIFYPRMFWVLTNRRADAATPGDKAGPFMFPFTRGLASAAVEKVLAGVRCVTSPQVSKSRNKGSGTTLTYTICANWGRALIGRVGAIELAASVDAGFALNETWIRAIMYDDFAVQHPESFVLCDTLLLS